MNAQHLATFFLLSAPLAVGLAEEASPPAPEVTGSYVLRRSAGAGCWLQVALVAADSVRFQLSCTRGAPSFNLGFLDERLRLRAGGVVFQTTAFSGPCEIRVRFRGRAAQVAQVGDAAACGFGHGVYAGGSYARTSRRPPPFDLAPNG